MKLKLKKLACAVLSSTAAILAAPAAHADFISFEAVTNVVTPTLSAGDTIYTGGQSFKDSGFKMTVNDSAFWQSLGASGQAGAIFDGSNPASCNQAFSCPSGNLSHYFGGENDGSITIMRDGGVGFFSLSSLNFAFLAPLGGLPDGVYGQLRLTGLLTDGSTVTAARDFAGQDQGGNFQFANWLLDPEFSRLNLSSLTIDACMFDGAGNCLNDASAPVFLAQFAVDDLQVEVPLPGTAPLMLLGMAGLAAIRRRRAQ
ncbi:MAG TPA: NF038120 family PEP-CTERM protein [Pseudoduganella sp.]